MTIRTLCLFLAVPWVGLQCVSVVSPGHTHILFILINLEESSGKSCCCCFFVVFFLVILCENQTLQREMHVICEILHP